jgi:hypothetical protein
VPSLRFPDTGTRRVELNNGKPAINARGYLYEDEDLTVPAEVYRDVNGVKGDQYPEDEDGRVSIRLDAYGRQVDYWGPASGQDRLWIVVAGVKSVVDADYNSRLDSLGARVTDLESDSAADATVLHKSGAETKTGVLTFVDSPVVPTPSGATAAANKGYVDTAVAAEATARATADTSVAAAAASALAAHEADTTSIHGIANTALLETISGAQAKADAAQAAAISAASTDAASKVAAHEADTTAVHGIADTSVLETQTGAQTKATAAQNAAISAAASDATTKASAAQAAAISAAATDATTKANAAQAAAIAVTAPATALPSLDYTGVVDATAAINAALVSGASVVTAAGTLKISGSGVIIPAGVSFDSSQTTFVYTGTGVAFTVAEQISNQSMRVVKFGKVRRSASGWWAGTDTTSIGLRLLNCNWNKIHITEFLSFETGVLVEGNDAGTCYNDIFLGRVSENRRNVRFLNVGTGWTNSNNFYGGALRVSSDVAWNGTDGINGPTASVMLDMSTAGNGNNFWGTTLEAGNCWRQFRIGSAYNNLWNCRFEQARAGGCEFLAGSLFNSVISGYDNYGPGSAIFTDAGQNTIIGTRGMRMYGDSASGTPANGGLAAYEAKGVAGAADVLFRGREFGGNLRVEINARGQSRHYIGAGAFPILLVDPTTLAPLSGGGYSAGRGNADPDVCIGRSPGNQAAWISNAPILRKTSSTTLTASGALAITAYLADVHIVTLQGNATSTTISTPANSTVWTQEIRFELVQDATGSRTWVAPTNVKWAGAAAPVLSTTAGRRDIFTLRYDPDITAWVEVGRSMNVG